MVFVNTGSSVINLPAGSAALDGAKVKFLAIAAVSFSVDPNGSDVISLNGTALTGGNKVTSSGVAGEEITFVWNNATTKWRTIDIGGVFIDGGS
jgi:hypothetical protein